MNTTMNKMVAQIKRARLAGTPLVAINTVDATACMEAIQAGFNGKGPGLVQWDCVRGALTRNDRGVASLDAALTATKTPREGLVNPLVFLSQVCPKLQANTVVFMLNAHLAMPDAKFKQAVWNLRDHFKSINDGVNTLVLLGPNFQLPSELQNDVLVIDDPLPGDEELKAIITDCVSGARDEIKITDKALESQYGHAVDALLGLGVFPAEQALAMSLTPQGIDLEQLWGRKAQMIGQAAGLSVFRGGNKFDGIAGLDALKNRMRRIMKGRKPFKVVVWMDEGTDDMAGQEGDNTGVSQDQRKVLLTEMEDMKYDGLVAYGVPGAAKSEFAKSLANEAGVLCIRMDMGAFKQKHLGDSEQAIRHAMKVIAAVAGPEGAFFVMTTNDVDAVRPQLLRRFRKGIWFFDLPTESERSAIWTLYLNRYPEVDPTDLLKINDDGWTGAEIRNCVEAAWAEDVDLVEAARDIIPVAVSGREDIERMRERAHGRYNSVTAPGVYAKPADKPEAGAAKGKARSVRLSE